MLPSARVAETGLALPMGTKVNGFTLIEALVALGLILVVLTFATRLALLAVDEQVGAKDDGVLQADADLALGHIIRDVRQAEEVRCASDELLLCLSTGEHLRYVVDPRERGLWREMLNAGHRARSRVTQQGTRVTRAAFEQQGSLVTVTLELQTTCRRSGRPVTLTVESAALPRN